MKAQTLTPLTIFFFTVATIVATAFNIPKSPVVTDRAEYVEINHVYNIDDKTGEPKLRMTQYIWWEWRDQLLLPVLDPLTKQETGDWKQGSDFVVKEYVVTYSGSSSPERVRNVLLSHENGDVVCIFWDTDDKVMRKVICGWLSETHTDFDVEIHNRKIVELNNRRSFSKR